MKALALVLLIAPAFARAAEVPEDLSSLTPDQKRELCLREITPESMIDHQYGSQTRQGLYDYATCRELVDGEPSLCEFFPGGPRVQTPLSPAIKTFTETGGDAKVRLVYEYAVCDSRSAGYLLLAGLVAGKPRDELLPYAKRMLNGEKGVSAEDLVDVSSAVYHAHKPRAMASQVKAGFFAYLKGKKACAGVALPNLRRECEWKGAAVDALRADDQYLCAEGDLMCRTLFEGESVCRETGAAAVKHFCEEEFPALKPSADDWKIMRSVL